MVALKKAGFSLADVQNDVLSSSFMYITALSNDKLFRQRRFVIRLLMWFFVLTYPIRNSNFDFLLKCVARFTAFILYCHLPRITV